MKQRASRYAWTEAKHARFVREGRGQGRGADYSPWLTVHDVSSQGRAARVRGTVTGRIHHLLSDLEWRAFLEADFAYGTIDIREQFPLDREETRRIAREAGVRHPADPRTGIDVVMTTDLVIDRTVAGARVTVPCFVKLAADLDRPRVVAKFEIERRYWERRGLRLGVRTELELGKARAETIAWIAACHGLHEERFPAPGYWVGRTAAFRRALGSTRATTFEQLDAELRAAGFAPGDAVSALRHLLAHRVLEMADLDRPFSQRDPLARFTASAGRVRGIVPSAAAFLGRAA